ncbi:MAG: hypothetical protein KA375_15880 [Vitreoscilla sp.]|nr:hypothetical protein [Burkholderiales bacterium]MBP6339078.1 hypothetical protein [Vitreoscilla sp.]MBP6676471.1 hypothetical protein [Vitreoscilla sp.]
MNPQRCSTLTGLVALLASLQACVFVPRTTQVYDAACQTVTRHMVLQEVQVAAIHGCQNEGCVALVVMAGAVGAASAVVSGTIVVTGNIAYWLEKQAQCRPIATPPTAPASAPPLRSAHGRSEAA